MLGVPRLILPVYHVPCEQLEGDYPKNKDAIADVLRKRNWTDWRKFRFIPLTDQEVAATLAHLARTIKTSIREIEPMIAAATAQQKSAVDVLTGDVESQKDVESITPSVNESYEIPEATLNGEFDRTHYEEVRKSSEYYVYTTRFDEVIGARSLADEDELLRMYGYLTGVSERLDIEAKSKPLIDALTELAAKGMGPKSLSTTILIDLSGSMRGAKIAYVVLAPLAERDQLHLGLDFMHEVVVGRVASDGSQDAADNPVVVRGAAEELHSLRYFSPPPGAND
jgi:hypothetical protein